MGLSREEDERRRRESELARDMSLWHLDQVQHQLAASFLSTVALAAGGRQLNHQASPWLWPRQTGPTFAGVEVQAIVWPRHSPLQARFHALPTLQPVER